MQEHFRDGVQEKINQDHQKLKFKLKRIVQC